LYTEYTHFSETTAGDILTRATAFGLLAAEVDGQDVRTMHAVATQFAERARHGGGPGFILANTYRYGGHHVGDINREYYRSKAEEQKWRGERDPIQILVNWMTTRKIGGMTQLEQIEKELILEMDKAVEFAVKAPYPTTDQVERHVYA
jgi:pyruvate dehydrogenase E1 component alpha subunit